MFLNRLLILTCFLALRTATNAQDQPPLLVRTNQLTAAISKKLNATRTALDKSTHRYLNKRQHQEEKLKNKIWKKDSTRAKELFGDIDARYAALKTTSGKPGKYTQNYSGRLDSLATALDFLKQSGTGHAEKLGQSLDEVKALQEKLNATALIKKQIQDRQKLIQDEFSRLGLIKQLKNYQKTAYYYQAQIADYKNLINKPDALAQKLLGVVKQMPQFKEFFAKNSLLGQLFPEPNAAGSPSVTGLQTRALVNQALAQRFGSSQQLAAAVTQNVQSAQSQLSQLRNQAQALGQGSFGNGDDPQMPNYRINHQKNKSLINRLEYGFNVQSQKAKWMFPTTTDLGAQLGFKLNDNGSIGIGMSCKIGWGKSWNQIQITHQGVGLRSYIDWKIKGSFYLSGGYEQNYRSAFKNIDALKDQSAWQSSGLLGLSKKYRVSKKLKGNIQLLWDFLSYQQSPKSNSILFRIGYQLK